MNADAYRKTLEGANLFRNQLLPQRNAWILEQVQTAFKRAGQYKTDSDIIDLVTTDLKTEIEKRFSHYSMDEIENILVLGAKGELGETTAISSRSVSGWLRNYEKEYRRFLAAFCKSERKEPLKIEAPRKLTDEELDQYIKSMYDQYHEDGTVFSSTFDLLWKYEKIDLNDKTVERLKGNAKLRVSQNLDLEEKGIILNLAEYKRSKEKDTENRIKNEAKRLAVAWHFDMMKLKEK